MRVRRIQLEQLDEAPLLLELQPAYVGFFKRLLPRPGMAAHTEGEHSAARSFNLLVTCSIALLMLAAVLRF